MLGYYLGIPAMAIGALGIEYSAPGIFHAMGYFNLAIGVVCLVIGSRR